MANYTCNQPYFNPVVVPLWSTRPTGRPCFYASVPGDGDAIEYYMNKIWDPGGGGGWEMWETVDLADSSGASYPDRHGSGWGACLGYRVVSKRFE